MMHARFDEDGYEGYYVLRSVKPDYSAVEVDDVLPSVEGDALLDQEVVTSYAQLNSYCPFPYTQHRSNPYSQYRFDCNADKDKSAPTSVTPSVGYVPSSTGIGTGIKQRFIEPIRGSFLNASNGSVLCSSDLFALVLAGKVCPPDCDHWTYFASQGLDIYDCDRKVKGSWAGHDKRFVLRKFRVHLRNGTDVGHLQFFQTAKLGVDGRHGVCPYGAMLNYYVYRRPEMQAPTYPPVVSVLPSGRQTFVSLVPGQILQLIVPESYVVETPAKLKSDHVRGFFQCKTGFGGYDCHYYKLLHKSSSAYPIFFSAKDRARQGVVIIPPVEKLGNSHYAIIHSPLDHLFVYPGHVDGLIFRRTDDDLSRHSHRLFLDRQGMMRVESHYTLAAGGYGASENCSVHDLRVQITDKNLTCFEISRLYDDATITAVETA